MKLSVGEIVLSLDESTLRYQVEAAGIEWKWSDHFSLPSSPKKEKFLLPIGKKFVIPNSAAALEREFIRPTETILAKQIPTLLIPLFG